VADLATLLCRPEFLNINDRMNQANGSYIASTMLYPGNL